METSKYGQVTFEKVANELHVRCKCSDDSGSCEWCRVYYHGPSEE